LSGKGATVFAAPWSDPRRFRLAPKAKCGLLLGTKSGLLSLDQAAAARHGHYDDT
jgi:hypothetical protein